MFANYTHVANQKDPSQMRQFVEKSDTEELCTMITGRICNQDISKILDDILQGIVSSSESSQAKRRKIVESVLQALRKAKISSYLADEIINRIVLDFPKYSKAHLIKLVEYCLNSIRNNDDECKSWKDLLPIILTVLEEEKFITHMGKEVSGKEYKSLIVRSVCTIPWEVNNLTPLAKMFCEMGLEKDDHDTVVKALCDKVSSTPLEEIPPLVHQLLRLCSNQDSRLLMETLRKYFTTHYNTVGAFDSKESFDDIETVTLKDVQETEGTVLYHIYQEAQVDHKNLKDFIRFLKNVSFTPEYILEPFILSVLLLVSQIYEDQIFDIVKSAMSRKIQEDEKYKNSAWTKSLLDDRWDIMAVVDKVIQNCNKDRHLVLKGLMDLSFVLMDNEQRSKDDSSALWHIGTQILQKLIKKRHDTAKTVVEIITFKIVGGGLHVSQYTDCLAYMCRKLTMIVLDYQIWVITLLDQLLLIPAEAALQVLYSILPLVRISPNVRDNLLLVLRKALYKKGISNRIMAVSGCLEILKNIKLQSSNILSQNVNSSMTSSAGTSASSTILTQVTLERSQTSKSLPSCNKSLCYEVLMILKKCFTHEFEVKLHLYEGLYATVVKNSEISMPVLEMLMTQFNSYYESDENVLPPIRFNLCTDTNGAEVVLTEPIAELIHVMHKIYVRVASESSTILDRLSIILESLCKRMTQTELEHLNVDDRLDLTDMSLKSQQKLLNVRLMIMVYETLMAYRIESWSVDSTNMAQQIYSLFKGYNNLIEFCKRITKSKKGDTKNKKDKDVNNTTIKKTTRSAAIKIPKTNMNFDTVYKIMTLMYSKSVTWTNKDQATYLKGHTNFHHYLLQSCIQLIQNAKALKNRDLMYHKNKYMKIYHKLGELLYCDVILDLENLRNFDEQTALLALECFKELCDVMCTTFFTELPEFLEFISEGDRNQSKSLRSASRQLERLTAYLQTLLRQCLNEEPTEDVHSNKIPMVLMETICHLVHKINFAEVDSEKLLQSLKKLAKTENADTPLSMMILQLLLWVEERTSESGTILNELCLEICGKLGTIDNEEITVTECYKILRLEALTQAYNILNTAIKEKLNNVSWMLVRLKAEQVLISMPDDDADAAREKMRHKERSLCQQVTHIIQTLHILTNSAIEPGASTDLTFKNLQYLYNLLSTLTKYFHNKSSVQNPTFQAVLFINVVQLAGKPLKNAFYNFVNYTESNQTRGKSRVKSDTYAQRNKVLKETKVIPRVVYEIEQFNKDILLLSKKTGVPLEAYIKKSITRDFRINNSQLTEGLERMNVSMLNTQMTTAGNATRVGENETTMDESVSEDDSPPKKRQKKTSQI